MARLKHPRIEMLSTGNELLDGTISDKHAQSLAQALRPMGLFIARNTLVPDRQDEIQKTLVESTQRASVLVVTGGLGPTTDDKTLEVAAKTFGSPLIQDAAAKKFILNRLKDLGVRKPNQGHKKQMYIPKGAQALENREGTAPGVYWNVGDRHLFFLPGVPRELHEILIRYLIPWLKKNIETSQQRHLWIFKTYGWPESVIQQKLKKFALPRGIDIGYRTHLPENHIKLEMEASSLRSARKKALPVAKRIRALFGASIFTEEDESFEQAIFKELRAHKTRVALAESCTGGLAASLLTQVAGSSEVLDRAWVVYSNQAKMDLLGVSEKTLSKDGAVSESVAREMARGALRCSDADCSVSITGIAGPSGGSKEKPVGTIWFAWAQRNRTSLKTKKLELGFKNRLLNQQFAAYEALHGFLRLIKSKR